MEHGQRQDIIHHRSLEYIVLRSFAIMRRWSTCSLIQLGILGKRDIRRRISQTNIWLPCILRWKYVALIEGRFEGMYQLVCMHAVALPVATVLGISSIVVLVVLLVVLVGSLGSRWSIVMLSPDLR